MRASAPLLIAALLLPAASQAGAPYPGFELRGQSAHFAFYAADSSPKPEIERSERFLAKVERELGLRVSGQSAYLLVGHPSDIFAATGLYTEGVTNLDSGVIMSVRGFHPHEIVHRVAGELGNPGLLFHEGLAVALGDKGRVGGQRVDRLARRALERRAFEEYLRGFRGFPPEEAYAVAGSFVGSLLRRYSVDQVVAFFRACGGRGVPCPEAFARVFGASLEQAVTEWQRDLG
jgi:hypothetical protein